jgi:hypothetical protein
MALSTAAVLPAEAEGATIEDDDNEEVLFRVVSNVEMTNETNAVTAMTIAMVRTRNSPPWLTPVPWNLSPIRAACDGRSHAGRRDLIAWACMQLL